jgi:hypothetical protein
LGYCSIAFGANHGIDSNHSLGQTMSSIANLKSLVRPLAYVRKFVPIQIDSSTWTPRTPPAQLLKWHGKSKKLSVGAALLHTALRTRPPSSTGIELADYWAWLRYGPAIDSDRRLGLRAAWDGIDPHQKTILSDDLGMGFTTYFLNSNLRVQIFRR